MSIEITYTRVGDYLFPDIILQEPPPETVEPLGRYARMHRAFLKEHKTILYNQLLLSERLFPLLREIDEAAKARLASADMTDKTAINRIEQGILSDLVYA